MWWGWVSEAAAATQFVPFVLRVRLRLGGVSSSTARGPGWLYRSEPAGGGCLLRWQRRRRPLGRGDLEARQVEDGEQIWLSPPTASDGGSGFAVRRARGYSPADVPQGFSPVVLRRASQSVHNAASAMVLRRTRVFWLLVSAPSGGASAATGVEDDVYKGLQGLHCYLALCRGVCAKFRGHLCFWVFPVGAAHMSVVCSLI